MRGRKPKPIEQKVREGNPGRRPLPEPLPVTKGIVKPENLGPEGSRLWDELVPELDRIGVLAKLDRSALEALVTQWERACLARKVIEAEGLFALGSTGQIVEHPAVGIERSAHQMFLRFAEQYGITAVARTRIAQATITREGGERSDSLLGIGSSPRLRAIAGGRAG